MSSSDPQPELQPDDLRWLVCPACHQALVLEAESGKAKFVRCTVCARRYPVVDGIPALLVTCTI